MIHVLQAYHYGTAKAFNYCFGDKSPRTFFCNGTVLISLNYLSGVGSPWMWTLAFWHHEGRDLTHGYAATRVAAMAAFAKSWRRE
jgi:hypothetical protein